LYLHSAHALARGTFALRGFALDDENVAASARRQMIGNAGADNASTDDDDDCSLHGLRGKDASAF
jgi:hypothetical protein